MKSNYTSCIIYTETRRVGSLQCARLPACYLSLGMAMLRTSVLQISDLPAIPGSTEWNVTHFLTWKFGWWSLNDGNALYSNPHRKTCLLLWGFGTKSTSKSDGERHDLVSLTYCKIPWTLSRHRYSGKRLTRSRLQKLPAKRHLLRLSLICSRCKDSLLAAAVFEQDLQHFILTSYLYLFYALALRLRMLWHWWSHLFLRTRFDNSLIPAISH